MKYILVKRHKDRKGQTYYIGDVAGVDNYSALRHCAKQLDLSEAQDVMFDIYTRRLERFLLLRIEEATQHPQWYITRVLPDRTQFYSGDINDIATWCDFKAGAKLLEDYTEIDNIVERLKFLNYGLNQYPINVKELL